MVTSSEELELKSYGSLFLRVDMSREKRVPNIFLWNNRQLEHTKMISINSIVLASRRPRQKEENQFWRCWWHFIKFDNWYLEPVHTWLAGQSCLSVLRTTQKAWMMPGIIPIRVRRMLRRKAQLQPRMMRTESGGKKRAKIRAISLQQSTILRL